MSKPCIRCGDCEVVCPVLLKPQLLHATINAQQWDKVEQLNLDACLFCNACTAACPSEIQLNTQFQTADITIKQLKEQARKSKIAQTRFEAKSTRVLRKENLQATLRAEKLLKASVQDKQAAIAAALERANRKYEDA